MESEGTEGSHDAFGTDPVIQPSSASSPSLTEASGADLPLGKGDNGKNHSPARKTFKAVSVNKTFRAATKLGDKPMPSLAVPMSNAPPGPSNLSTNRPRLVVKSGSGLRDSVPKFSTVVNGMSGSGPEPNAVWNKNRLAAPPPPEPRNLTDEELKKYGIHMANRLQADEAQGQSNWADMDGDDDDWAPETITWTDGTKITVPTIDDNHSTASQGTTKDPPPTDSAPVAPPPPPAEPASFPNPRVTKGLVLKSGGGGSAEKPTLVAKVHEPAGPAKSPWAPLPPIDKASPADAEVDILSSIQRLISHKGEPAPKPPIPHVKEIGVDDFSRPSWRDGQVASSRELFNSQSGRYEPVFERHQPGGLEGHNNRQPALLQRSSREHHPAEPSPAFQTSRVPHEVPWGRRRGSSNASGGSGPFLPRIYRDPDGSLPPPQDALDTRRASLVSPNNDNPVSPRSFSSQPHGLQHPGQQWNPRNPPVAAAQVQPQQGDVVRVGPVHTSTADIEFQKKVMHEKRELAIKRRQDEEARALAERNERLRLKLEALGPAPERRSARKERDDAAVPATRTPTQQDNGGERGATSDGAEVNGISTPATEAAAQPSPVVEPDPHLQPQSDQPGNEGLDAHANNKSAPDAQALPPQTAHDGRKGGHPWNSAPPRPERLTAPWGPSAPQSSSRNVWAPPYNNRGLGNGTFNPDLGRAFDPHSHGPSQKPRYVSPPPLDPPVVMQTRSKWVASVMEHDQVLREERAAARRDHERQCAEKGLNVEEIQPVIKETWRPIHIAADGTRMHKPPPPPSLRTPVGQEPRHGPSGVTSWEDKSRTAAAAAVVENDQGLREERAAERDQSALNGMTIQETKTQPVIARETWRPIHINADTGRANKPPPPAPLQAPNNQIPSWEDRPRPSSGYVNSSSSLISGHSSSGRSRFFPPREPGADPIPPVPLIGEGPAPPPSITTAGHILAVERSSSPSPPPPTTDGHPAYDGNAHCPLVSFPKPQPTVKLPPTALVPRGGTSSPKDRHVPPDLLASPHKTRQDQTSPSRNPWQDKFDNLLKPNSLATKVVGIDPSSRGTLDHPVPGDAATVSLPTTPFANLQAEIPIEPITSKPPAEECFEEQEMGSLPQLRLPHNVPEAAWEPAPPQMKPLPRRFLVSQPQSRSPIHFEPGSHGCGLLRVYLRGMREAKKVTMGTMPPSRRRGRNGTRQRLDSGHRGGGGGGSRAGSVGDGDGGGGGRTNSVSSGQKEKDDHGSPAHEQGLETAPSHSRRSRRGERSGYRGRRDNWSQHAQGTLLA